MKKRKVRSEDEEENSDVKISPEELALNQNIIALVKEHDVLYDRKRVRDSKNLTAKNEAWTNIANALGISGKSIFLINNCRVHEDMVHLKSLNCVNNYSNIRYLVCPL